MLWVSSYFNPLDSLDINEPDLALRSNNYLDINDSARTPTSKRFTEGQLHEVTEPGVMMRAAEPRWSVPREVFWEITQRALVDGGDLWPEVNVLFLWCDMTTPDVIWAMKSLRDRVRAGQKKGAPVRKTEEVVIRGGNHFVSAWCVHLSRCIGRTHGIA